MKNIIETKFAPKPVGPYSQAVKANGVVYVSGQLGIDPVTGKPAEGIKEQTRQVLKNIDSILKAAGSSLSKVLKVNIYLRRLEDFQNMNEAYKEFFPNEQPARTTIQAGLLDDYLIEMDVIATE